MEKTCLDANVLLSYLMELVNEPPASLKPFSSVIDRLSTREDGRPWIVMDSGGKIQNEYEHCCGLEWTRAILIQWLDSEALTMIEAKPDRAFAKSLDAAGMPKSCDRWYLWTAHSAKSSLGVSVVRVFTNDIDLLDPKKKKTDSASRAQLMSKTNSPIQRLAQQHGVEVRCVANVLD